MQLNKFYYFEMCWYQSEWIKSAYYINDPVSTKKAKEMADSFAKSFPFGKVIYFKTNKKEG
jgi:hypothetical protein